MSKSRRRSRKKFVLETWAKYGREHARIHGLMLGFTAKELRVLFATSWVEMAKLRKAPRENDDHD